MTAVVTSEPRVYGHGSPHSYWQDIAITAPGIYLAGTEEARERLSRYARELDVEMASGSAEGRRAAIVGAELRRETRASAGATSSTISGFTTPYYLVDDWAAYRAAPRSFMDQTTNLDLPPYGLQVNIPSFSSAPTTGQQAAENYGVSETDPSGSNIQVNLVTVAGQITISQQLEDRGGMSGLAFDQIVLKQLQSQIDASKDSYVLTQATANAYTTTWSSSASWTNFLTDLAKAREGLADSTGVRLAASHLFTTSDQFGYWTRQLDLQSRPILTPDSGAIVQAAQMNDPKWESWTGVHMGPLRWHTDDNIPASGSNTQLIVARPETIYTFDGAQFSFAYPETSSTAQTLSVVVGLRAYIGAVVRFPKAIAVITSNAYPTSNV